jgi:hypothetical protein
MNPHHIATTARAGDCLGFDHALKPGQVPGQRPWLARFAGHLLLRIVQIVDLIFNLCDFLSRSMRAASFTASASLGNVFMLGHANDTPEIAAWVRHVYKDCLSEQLDSQGDPIVWIKI